MIDPNDLQDRIWFSNRFDDGSGGEFSVGVRATSAIDAQTRVRAHFGAQCPVEFQLSELRTDPADAPIWLSGLTEDNRIVAKRLERNASDATPTDTKANGALYRCNPIPFSGPLQPQFGDFGSANLPADMVPVLFPDGAKHCLAVIDGNAIVGLVELLEQFDVTHRCLYVGELKDTLGDEAPYLIALEPDNAFLRYLFTAGDGPADFWLRDWGCFLPGWTGFDAAFKHIRHLMVVQTAANKRMYIKFWQQTVLNALVQDKMDEPFGDVLLRFGPVCYTCTSRIEGPEVRLMSSLCRADQQ